MSAIELRGVWVEYGAQIVLERINLTVASGAFLRAQEQKIRDELADRGMVIADPADGEKEFIDLATTTVWPKFYDMIGGKEVLDTVLASLGRPAARFVAISRSSARHLHCTPKSSRVIVEGRRSS